MMIKEVKQEWFKDHEISMKIYDGLQIIDWGRPNSGMYRIRYILSNNNIFISGDLGEAVYTLTCKATLKDIKDFNLHYFTQKLTAFCGDRWDFDQDSARKRLADYWEWYDINERHEDGKDIYKDILSFISECISVEHYRQKLMTIYETTTVDSSIIEDVWDFGQIIPSRLIGYWVGLQMISEELFNKENPND